MGHRVRNRMKSDLRESPESPSQAARSLRNEREEVKHISPRATWLWGGAAAGLIYASLPPLHWAPLGWVGTIGWIHLARRAAWTEPRGPARLYTIGLLFWLVTIQWVRLPHPSTYLGWLVLSAYLAIYVPWFIGATGWLMHRWRWPSAAAAPVVWIGLEVIRGYFFTGFSLALLAHSQTNHPIWLQLASVGGAYLVSGSLVLVGALLETAWARRAEPSRATFSIAAAAIVAFICFAWGQHRLSLPIDAGDGSSARVALIQGSVDTTFDNDPEFGERTVMQYAQLTAEAVQRSTADQPLQLIVWPESMFGADIPIVFANGPVKPPASVQRSEAEFTEYLERLEELGKQKTRWLAELGGGPMLVGCPIWEADREGVKFYNSAILVSGDGRILARYDKMHPVMFGEYIPLGRWFPWVYRLTPMEGGLTAGRTPQLMTVGPLRMMPAICFENTVPHLMRRQRRELEAAGSAPNCLVTVTNDGWFWGSSLLDLHLACAVMRAVEHDLPMLVAANTGLSAHIDPRGRILTQGPRRAEQVVLAQVRPGPGQSGYAVIGDWLYLPCVAAALTPLIAGLARRRRFGSLEQRNREV